MKLLFKQKFFSWFDSYDVFDENGNVYFSVKGKLAFGHAFDIYDKYDNLLGEVKQRIFHFLPHFDLYINGEEVGTLIKEFTFFKQKFTITCRDWQIEGDWFEWDYYIKDSANNIIASISRYVETNDQQFIQVIPQVVQVIAQRIQLEEQKFEGAEELSVFNPYIEEKCFPNWKNCRRKKKKTIFVLVK